ncbi:hypothetical protein [Polaribacter sp.]|uniref:hypothetical protein n=1 Tax=Polaribacter sp. TaxID=1920175 RepID=UPI003F6B4332
MKYFIFILLIFFGNRGYCQQVEVNISSHKYLFLGLPNSIDIYNKGIDCSDLKIEVDNANFTKDLCNLILTPNLIGPLKIIIYDRFDNVVSEKSMIVVDIPLKAEIIAPIDQDKKVLYKKARGLKITMDHPNLYFNPNHTEISYDFILIRNKNVLFFKEYFSTRFDNDILKVLSSLIKEDILILSDIVIKTEEGFYKVPNLCITIGG